MEKLQQNYQNALEIRHRVKVELLEETVVGLFNISAQLVNYRWTLETQVNTMLIRIHEALTLLLSMVREDLSEIQSMIMTYKEEYRKQGIEDLDTQFLKVLMFFNFVLSL